MTTVLTDEIRILLLVTTAELESLAVGDATKIGVRQVSRVGRQRWESYHSEGVDLAWRDPAACAENLLLMAAADKWETGHEEAFSLRDRYGAAAAIVAIGMGLQVLDER